MSKFLRVAACLCVFLIPTWADQIVLKNGDRVTGSIVKQDGKTITIKTDHFGVVSTSWDQVDTLTTTKPLTVVLQGGKSVQGTLATERGRVVVSSESGTIQAAPAEVTAIRDPAEQRAYERLLRPGWLELWAGSANLGFAGTAGNAKTSTFTTGVNAVRATRSDRTSLHFDAIKASALVSGRSADTAQAVRGGVAYDHNAGGRMFVNVFNDYEYDRFQDLDLRFVIGGGAGVHALKTDRSRLDLLAGVDYNHSKFSTFSRNASELYWGDDYSLKLTGATSLVQGFRMFHSLNDTGIRRINFDLGAATKIVRWLSWNVSVSDRYLSRPAPGRKTNDFLYSTGLGITFSR